MNSENITPADEKTPERFELGNIHIYVSKHHRFGTDAFLLADFAAVHKNHRVCDMCSGCGIIPLIMCRRDPPREIYAAEIMPQAIELLQKSVADNALQDIIRPVLCDIKDAAALPREYFDIVTVNPPYRKSGTGKQRAAESEAAARHELLCDINDVAAAAARLLKYGGSLKLCQIPQRLTDVLCAMRENGIEPKVLRFVCARKGDKPWLFLVSGKKGAKPGLEMLPEFIVYENDEYTKEMQDIYKV